MEYPPVSVDFVGIGTTPPCVGAEPWVNTRDDDASYIDTSLDASQGFRCHWPAIPSAVGKPAQLVVRARATGTAWVDVWGIDEASGPYLGSTEDFPETWTDLTLTLPDFIVPAGSFTLTFDSDALFGTTLARVTYIAIIGGDPYRRTSPRDDVRRNWPRPKSIRASNRTGGGYI